jgi:hypothetical protein
MVLKVSAKLQRSKGPGSVLVCRVSPVGYKPLGLSFFFVTWWRGSILSTKSNLFFLFVFQTGWRTKYITRQSIYIEARSRNHCCGAKTISITHSEWVCVALVIQHAKRMRRIAICGLSGCTIFFPHYLTNCTIQGVCVCFDFLYFFYLKHLSFWEELREILS